MEFKFVVGNIAEIKTGAIIVNFFEGMERLEGDIASVDVALDGAISELVNQGEIKGKLNEITVIHSLGKLAAARVVVAGLGKASSELGVARPPPPVASSTTVISSPRNLS